MLAQALAVASSTFLAIGAPPVIRAGGPSAPADAKVAVVASARADLGGAPFTVVDAGGRIVLHGSLTLATGSPAPWAHAYWADLSQVRRPGRYRVAAAGLRSRPWLVERSPEPRAIRLLLRFLAANADGEEPSPLHAPAHLNDAVLASGPLAGRHLDLTGGWMDAGDMLHFTQTTAFTAALLEAAARVDPADAEPLEAAADVGIRWLVKAHPEPGVFVAQVGDQRDHDRRWRLPERDDASRRVGIGTRFAYPGISGDLAGKAAAALALAAGRADGALRRALLTQAQDWYAAGREAGRATPSLPGGFYVSSTWRDDMAAGAAALARATGDPAFTADAVRYLAVTDPATGFDWDSFGAFAAADLCGALGAPPSPDPSARELGCRRLRQAAEAAAAQAETTAFVTPGAFDWGQPAASSGAGAIAALGARVGLAPRGLVVAAAARDWLLGRNPWGASFVVGYGPGAPRHPHHWARLLGPGRPVGAVVGGPAPPAILRAAGFEPYGVFNSTAAAYEDNAGDYVTSEPTAAAAAAAVLLLAALAASSR